MASERGMSTPRTAKDKSTKESSLPLIGKDGSEVEAVAENHFSNEMVRGPGDTHAHTEIDFPLGREIEVDGGKELVLLEGDRIKVGGGPDRAVILKAAGDFLGEIVAEFEIG